MVGGGRVTAWNLVLSDGEHFCKKIFAICDDAFYPWALIFKLARLDLKMALFLKHMSSDLIVKQINHLQVLLNKNLIETEVLLKQRYRNYRRVAFLRHSIVFIKEQISQNCAELDRRHWDPKI